MIARPLQLASGIDVQYWNACIFEMLNILAAYYNCDGEFRENCEI